MPASERWLGAVTAASGPSSTPSFRILYTVLSTRLHATTPCRLVPLSFWVTRLVRFSPCPVFLAAKMGCRLWPEVGGRNRRPRREAQSCFFTRRKYRPSGRRAGGGNRSEPVALLGKAGRRFTGVQRARSRTEQAGRPRNHPPPVRRTAGWERLGLRRPAAWRAERGASPVAQGPFHMPPRCGGGGQPVERAAVFRPGRIRARLAAAGMAPLARRRALPELFPVDRPAPKGPGPSGPAARPQVAVRAFATSSRISQARRGL